MKSLIYSGDIRPPDPALGEHDSTAGFSTALLAAATTLLLIFSVIFIDDFSSSRLQAALLLILMVQLLTCPRIFFPREFAAYGAFAVYNFIALLWTPDLAVAANSITPIANFFVILLLYGTWVAFHDLRAVATGVLLGFSCGAILYTAVAGFPFSRPQDFSYNAVASMYLFGIFAALLFGWAVGARLLSLLLALVFLLLVVATTSIKTNLGIMVGVLAAAVVYLRPLTRGLARNGILVAVLAGAIVYGALSNRGVTDRLHSAAVRVSAGLEVLSAREDNLGYVGFDERRYWMEEGLKGSLENPLFGHGVEAFRYQYGITSHSTPVDLLYNSGLIGLVLFYSILASILLRLYRSANTSAYSFDAVIFAFIVCSFFMSFSSNSHTSTFLAATLAMVVPLLARARQVASPKT